MLKIAIESIYSVGVVVIITINMIAIIMAPLPRLLLHRHCYYYIMCTNKIILLVWLYHNSGRVVVEGDDGAGRIHITHIIINISMCDRNDCFLIYHHPFLPALPHKTVYFSSRVSGKKLLFIYHFYLVYKQRILSETIVIATAATTSTATRVLFAFYILHMGWCTAEGKSSSSICLCTYFLSEQKLRRGKWRKIAK